jgi:hypothetical protein
MCLNGPWGFEPEWGEARTITVPFAWETPASGVASTWLERASYTRRIEMPAWGADRVFLCFGAVHYRAAVHLNGDLLGIHEGGSTPFEFDLTGRLAPGQAGELRVQVEAPADKAAIPHGKQRSIPRDDYDAVCFTPTSGIWQPVWLEARGRTYLADLRIDGAGLDRFQITGRLAGDQPSSAVRVSGAGVGAVIRPGPGGAFEADLKVARPRLWSPNDPYVYELLFEVGEGEASDRLTATCGLRRIETVGEELRLNGRRLYLRGVLDQGYWPLTGMTAPTDQALREDLVSARRLGYNLVRKHVKLEDPRWLNHADRLGMLVWAEPPCPSRYSPESAATYLAELPDWIRRDADHPSIVIWALYNEEWGLDWDVAGRSETAQAARDAYQALAGLDRTRPIIENSGWSHVVTDLVDWHHYETDPGLWANRVAQLANGVSETFPVTLGAGYTVDKSLYGSVDFPRTGVPLVNSEYGGGTGNLEQAWLLRWQTQEIRRHDRFAGYVYTELADVEHEPVGLLDAWRDPKDLAGLDPAEVNAETVIVIDLTPQAPGADIATPTGPLTLTAHISHHGLETMHDAVLKAAWAPPGTSWPPSAAGAGAGGAKQAGDLTATARTGAIVPHRLSPPVELTVSPPGRPARLHLWLEHSGQRVAHTHIDAGPTRQPGRPGILPG